MNGRTNVPDERRSARPGLQTDELVQQVGQRLRSDRRLTLSVNCASSMANRWAPSSSNSRTKV